MIEDEITLTKIIGKFLSKHGISYDYALSGYDAINYYRSKKYDVIIVDLDFPGKDVYEILLEINMTQLDAKVIIYSGNLNREIMDLLEVQFKVYKILSKEAGHKGLQAELIYIKESKNYWNLINKGVIIY